MDARTNLHDPRYERQVKYRCISCTVNVSGAVMYGKAREYGRRQFPGFTNADHDKVVERMDRLIPKIERRYRDEAEAAARETWGRSIRPTDYKIAGVYSEAFSEARKDALRKLVRDLQRAKDVRRMHLAAKRRASKYHPVP